MIRGNLSQANVIFSVVEYQIIESHGGYRNLVSYQMSEIVYDATIKFCDRFIEKRSRTHDQMVQATRRGNNNLPHPSDQFPSRQTVETARKKISQRRRFHGKAI